MKLKKLLTKSLLVAAGLCVGTNGAWAYTSTTYDFTLLNGSDASFSSSRTTTCYAETHSYTFNILDNISVTGFSDFDGCLAIYNTLSDGIAIHGTAGYGVYSPKSRYWSVLNLVPGAKVKFTYISGDANTASLYYYTRTSNGTAYIGTTQLEVSTSVIGSDEEVIITKGSYLVIKASGNARVKSMTIYLPETTAEAEQTIASTGNDTYRVTSSSTSTDGTSVQSVYGISMTYHGTWTYQYASNRLGDQVYASAIPSSLTNNVPQDNEYLAFSPTVSGNLTIMACYYNGQQYYLVDGSNGHILAGYKASGGNDYGNHDFGSVEAGKTYYFYATSNQNGYQFGGFTFTPGDITRTSYYVNTDELINVGDVVSSVAGITMTYGGAAETTWSVGTNYSTATANNSDGNNVPSGNAVPTKGTFVSFTPTVKGKLNVRWLAYALNKTVNAYLTDGTSKETVTQSSTGNGIKNDEFSAVLAAGTTYYLYFSKGNYNSQFCGFTFTPTPASVSATIGGTGFATFSSEYPLDFSATTTKAYVASLTGENTVLLSPVTAVPASTGLLLKGATEYIPVKAGFVSAPATNLLKASTADDIAATDAVNNIYHYVLANGSNGVGFYNLAADKNIGAGKAYLETTTALAATSSARAAWVFADDETTGINMVNGSGFTVNGSDIYDLQGRRVAQPAKGLYIMNGRKVVVK